MPGIYYNPFALPTSTLPISEVSDPTVLEYIALFTPVIIIIALNYNIN